MSSRQVRIRSRIHGKSAAASRLAIVWAGLTLTMRARAETVVQLPIDALLDARPVSTLTGGKVVPWTAGQGVDLMDGLVTNAAEASLGQTGTALPDDGTFPANADHPQALLHFSNSAPSASFQAHLLDDAGTFDFAVPKATYTALFLFMTSSQGASPLTVTMGYDGGTTSTFAFTLPDWGTGQPLPKDPPIFFNLASGMHKWTAQNAQVDVPVHTITGVLISPDSNKDLVTVAVTKAGTGQRLLLWGAVGSASSSVDSGAIADAATGAGVEAGPDGGGDASIGDSSDAASSADVTSTSGAVVSTGSLSGGSGSASAGSSGSLASSGAVSASSGSVPRGSGGATSGASSLSDAHGGASTKGCSLSSLPMDEGGFWGFLVLLAGLTVRRRERTAP